MSGKNIFFVNLVALIISGCGEPKYVNESDLDNNGQLAKETKVDCSLSFSNSGICLHWYWETKATAGHKGTIIFKTYKLNILDQTPVEIDAAQVPNLILWMPSMGHGSSKTITDRIDIGTYRASNVFFIMPGEWELLFQINIAPEVIDEAKVNIIF